MMQMKDIRMIWVFGITLLFIGTSSLPLTANVIENKNTILFKGNILNQPHIDFSVAAERVCPISSEIEICNLDLATLTDTSMIVTWTTSENSSTCIDYGVYPFLLNHHYCEENQTSVTFHYLKLDGLQPGITYFFRVCSGESRSRLRIFTTLIPPSGEYLFSFATLADKHVYSYDADSIALSRVAVEEINCGDVEFVIDKGDMGYPFDQSKIITDDFNIPYYPIFGDNDFQDSHGGVGEFTDVYNLDSTYYSFDFEGYHFIIVDSADRDGKETGAISDEEFVWLMKDLVDNADKNIMIFMHHPASVMDFPDVMALNAEDGFKLRSLISRYNVVGVFSGHTHRNKVTYSLMTGAMPYAETAAVHKYPAGYNIYKVYTNGYMQSFYKVNSEITESRRNGEIEDYLSPLCGRFGFVRDRNFVVNYHMKENDYVVRVKTEDVNGYWNDWFYPCPL